MKSNEPPLNELGRKMKTIKFEKSMWIHTAKNGKKFLEVDADFFEKGDKFSWKKKNGNEIFFIVIGIGTQYEQYVDDVSVTGSWETTTKERAYVKKVRMIKADGTVKNF